MGIEEMVLALFEGIVKGTTIFLFRKVEQSKEPTQRRPKQKGGFKSK